jgi:group I intron endonuclease
MVIYKITNLINGKIYIGQDRYNNKNYFGSGLKIKRAMERYGKDNFTKEIIDYCNSIEDMNTKEIFWISELNSVNPSIGYNIASGGQGGEIIDWQTKIYSGINDKIKQKATGRLHSKETKEKLSNYWESYRMNKEKKEHKNPNKVKIGKENPFYGKHHIGDMDRFGKHRKGVTPTNAYKIRRIDTGEIYESADSASKSFQNPNTARRAIVNVCKGIRSDFQGIKFEFI